MNNEITKQFNEIFSEHHRPENKDKKRLEKNRKRRAETIKKDIL